MLTYWETLIARKSNITVSDSYAALWGKKFQSGYTVETYTGTLPATLTGTKAGYLVAFKIYGNTAQDGTPTPSSPIVPSGCGELETTGVHAGQYKLPILSNSTVTDIYLGEVPTTRRIKKLVLTGAENWQAAAASGGRNRFTLTVTNVINADTAHPFSLCTHLPLAASGATYSTDDVYTIASEKIYIRLTADYNALVDFKSYLAAQYANGTPVTIWYVLAEPETGTVNKPLMKIGDYADTIDSEQTAVQIPTVAGETTISWVGEGLAPSEVEFVYKVKG